MLSLLFGDFWASRTLPAFASQQLTDETASQSVWTCLSVSFRYPVIWHHSATIPKSTVHHQLEAPIEFRMHRQRPYVPM